MGVVTVLPENQIYNYNFQHPPNSIRRWPPGWEKVGGNEDSSWQRVAEYARDGRYCMLVENPSAEGFCGVRENPPHRVAVTPGEKWRVAVTMRAGQEGKGRLAVIFLDGSGQAVSRLQQDFELGTAMQEYALEYFIPSGVAEALVEVGVVGPNRVWLDRVVKTRLAEAPQPMTATGVTPNFYFVAIRPTRGAEPEVQFGRHLGLLAGKKQEQITFSPSSPVEVSFQQFYFSSTGPVAVELAAGQTGQTIRCELPATEICLCFSRPLRVIPGGPPLVVKVANHSAAPLSYTFLATGTAG